MGRVTACPATPELFGLMDAGHLIRDKRGSAGYKRQLWSVKTRVIVCIRGPIHTTVTRAIRSFLSNEIWDKYWMDFSDLRGYITMSLISVFGSIAL